MPSCCPRTWLHAGTTAAAAARRPAKRRGAARTRSAYAGRVRGGAPIRSPRSRVLRDRAPAEGGRTMALKLHDHPLSPNGRKVRITAHELGLPLEMAVVDLMKGEHKSPPNLARNPNGKVPTLEDRSEEHTSELQSRENLVCRL